MEARITLPDPVLRIHDGITVVRDDLLPGGTKRRALHVLLDDDHTEFCYASPAYGHAQLALAHACRDYGKQATIFVAARKDMHPLTRAAQFIGARIIEVPMGFLSHCTSKAKAYVEYVGPKTKLMPFGLDDPRFIATLADVARQLPIQPTEVWSITSSGVLSRALQQAWPRATFYGVRVGAEPDAGKCVKIYQAVEAFDQKARILPPFDSNVNYDAKAWRFVKQYASPGAVFWNVA